MEVLKLKKLHKKGLLHILKDKELILIQVLGYDLVT